jgi:hypothetical protein
MTNPELMSNEATDRQSIRELIDAWAHCADRRLPQQQAELITPDGSVKVYSGNPAISEPVQQLRGRDELAKAFKILENYDGTTRLNEQSTIKFDGDQATAETYCFAHHLWVEDGQRTLMIMSIR